MKIERYQARKPRQFPWLMSCGCLGVGGLGIVITAIAALIIFPQIADVALSTVGIEAIGNTDEVLSAPIVTVPVLMDTQTVGAVTLSTGSYSQTFNGSGAGYTVVVGDTDDTMQRQMQVTFTEDGLVAQCRILSTICSASGTQMRNATFDLRSGGLIINGEFQLPTGQWQDAGLVVQFTTTNMLDIVGIDIAGRVYAPTAPEFASLINEAESRGNLFIQALSAQAGFDTFNLGAIIADDTTLTFILR
ncbi:MAG: hypothetical protein WBC91_23545 [Phototrophicaceae bacterium]